MGQNANEGLVKLQDAAGNLPAGLVTWAVAGVVVLLLLYLLWKILKGRSKPAAKIPDLEISVAGLPACGPPAQGPALVFHNVPVGLAVLVLAPVGRTTVLPPLNQLDRVIDAVVPGLATVVAKHKPVVRKWPAQLSSRGFANLFFSNAKLPGDGGKGTPWCATAGAIKIGKKSVMVGMVMRTATPTNFGRFVIERDEQWLDVLRIKDGG
jgi:hypothetical protein